VRLPASNPLRQLCFAALKASQHLLLIALRSLLKVRVQAEKEFQPVPPLIPPTELYERGTYRLDLVTELKVPSVLGCNFTPSIEQLPAVWFHRVHKLFRVVPMVPMRRLLTLYVSRQGFVHCRSPNH